MLERDYQAHVIRRLKKTFEGCFVLKNDSGYLPGVPDLTVFYWEHWAVLEVKRSEEDRGKPQPNQEYYVDLLNEMSYAAFIYPENEEDIFNDLQRAFKSRRATRISKR